MSPPCVSARPRIIGSPVGEVIYRVRACRRARQLLNLSFRLLSASRRTKPRGEFLCRLRDRMEIARQAGFCERPMKRHVRQGAVDDVAHRAKPVEIDAGIDAHRLEQERRVFNYDVAAGTRRVWAAAEPAERGVEILAAGRES